MEYRVEKKSAPGREEAEAGEQTGKAQISANR